MKEITTSGCPTATDVLIMNQDMYIDELTKEIFELKSKVIHQAVELNKLNKAVRRKNVRIKNQHNRLELYAALNNLKKAIEEA